jgi:spore coat protein U-like protein
MKRSVLVISVLSLAIASAAFAGSDDETFDVTASVAANCVINSADDIDFGAYDPMGANDANGTDVTAEGAIEVRCTRGATGLTLGLDAGSNDDNGARRMTTGTYFLTYSLNKPSAAGTDATDSGSAWGNSGAGLLSITSDFETSGAPQTYKVFGTLAKGQIDAGPGDYTDTVTATVNF